MVEIGSQDGIVGGSLSLLPSGLNDSSFAASDSKDLYFFRLCRRQSICTQHR
jgi:hypothetical protein